MYIYLNNDFVEAEKAMLHVSDLAIQRGYGIFDFFRVRKGVLLFVEDHLDRFLHSAKLMHLQVPYTKDALHAILKDLAHRNQQPESGMRMILTGGYSPDAYQPVASNFIVMQSPLVVPDATTPKSVSIITHDYVRDIPEAKTLNYTMGIWLQPKVKEHQADDVLYHHNGVVTEFPRCNFFIVKKDGTVVTPAHHALKGVTRKRVLELSRKGYAVAEGVVTLADVLEAEEAFLTSSTKRIQAIVKIDGRMVGNGTPGKVTTQLLHELLEAERNYVSENAEG